MVHLSSFIGRMVNTMRKRIYILCEHRAWSKRSKDNLFLACNMLFFSLIGAVAWLLFGRLLLSGWAGLLCFVGYPLFFFGALGGIMYLWRQDT